MKYVSFTDNILLCYQLGKFVIGQPPTEIDAMIPEDQVPKGLRFPALFKGEGVRGHRYHVFEEPRYFA
jgi:hypothetical protein